MPDEIAELRELLETATVSLAAAEDDMAAAEIDYEEAKAASQAANQRWQEADRAEAEARRSYIDALKRHGMVRTADGPKPAGPAEVIGFIRVTPSPEMRAAVLAAAGMPDLEAPARPGLYEDCPRRDSYARPLGHHGTWPNPAGQQ